MEKSIPSFCWLGYVVYNKHESWANAYGIFESHSSFACRSLVNGDVKPGVNAGDVLRGIQFPLTLTGILNRVKMTLVILRKRKCQGNGVCQLDSLAADAAERRKLKSAICFSKHS